MPPLVISAPRPAETTEATAEAEATTRGVDPNQAAASMTADRTFLCYEGGEPDVRVLSLDTKQKIAKYEFTTRETHLGCAALFVDGSYTPLPVGPNAAYCSIGLGGMGNQYQTVTIDSRKAVVASGKTTARMDIWILDFATGILRFSDGAFARCRTASP